MVEVVEPAAGNSRSRLCKFWQVPEVHGEVMDTSGETEEGFFFLKSANFKDNIKINNKMLTMLVFSKHIRFFIEQRKAPK